MASIYSAFYARWLWNISSRQGIYGSGERGLPSWEALGSGFLLVGKLLPLPVVLIFCTALFLLWTFPKRNLLESGMREKWGALAVLTLANTLQYLIVLKHPGDRYLIPQLACLALALPIFWELLAHRLQLSLTSIQRVSTFALGLVLVLFLYQPLRMYLGDDLEKRNQLLTAMAELEREHACKVVPFYRSSVHSYALAFGNNYARYQFTEAFKRLYPEYLSYEPGVGFVDVERKPVAASAVFQANSIVRAMVSDPEGVGGCAFRFDTSCLFHFF